MTGKPNRWTRRQFAQAVAASSLLGWNALAATTRNSTGIGFVGSSPEAATGAIHVFRVSGLRWTAVQTVPAAAPAHLVSHPTLPVLYAVHAIGLWNNLPRGAISAYRIAPATGHLTLLNTQPLSLSATCPRHAAVSLDGRYLLAAAERSGLYNLLPIAPDGALQPSSAIRKEAGLDEGPLAKTAAPRQVVFHPDGATILTADSGQEAITAFSFDHESISLRHRLRTHAGSGPSQIDLSPSGHWIYAQHATDGSIAAHRSSSAQILPPSHIHMPRQPGPAIMAMHPSGRFLVTAGSGSITSLSIDSRSGRLAKCSTAPSPEPLQVLTIPSCGTHLLGTARSGHVMRLAFEGASGTIGDPRIVAEVDAASSLLFRPAAL